MADEAFFEGSDEESGIAESVAAEESFPERFRIKILLSSLTSVQTVHVKLQEHFVMITLKDLQEKRDLI